jgi:transcriptional regulator with XRE-family HTH domain
MSEQRRARPAIQCGPTAATVAANVKRIRKARGLSTYALSGQLSEAGRPIAPSAVAKVERGERQVTVDDLMALAVALDVSPSALLLPPTDDPSEKVEITGTASVPADQAWDWMDGRRRLDQPTPDPNGAALLYALHSRPPIRRNREIGGH